MENINTNDVSGLLVPVVNVNEDSVDIYDDMDVGFHSNADNSTPNASQLKDSMDLYEEIVTEEQQSRETLYTDLKSRFQAAQTQIKELRRRLEQVEMQNTGLNTENFRLKKNICALLQTARQEVTRKDTEIQRLNQRSEKGRHHYLSQSSRPPPPPPRPLSTPPPPSGPPPPPPRLPTSPPRENQPSRNPPHSARTESSANQPLGSCIETQASKAPSRSHSKSSSRGGDIPDKHPGHSVSKSCSSSSGQHSDSDKHKSKQREDKYQSHKPSESTDRRPKSDSHPNKDCHASEKNRSHKADKDTGRKHDSRSCKSRSILNVEGHHRSNRSKSPPPEIIRHASPYDDTKGRCQERRQDKTKVALSDCEQSAARSSKEGSRDHRKIKSDDGRNRSNSKERTKSSLKQHTERHTDSPKEREGERPLKDQQKKEERRHEDDDSRKHKKNKLSEMSRKKQRLNESDKGKDVTKESQEKTHNASERASKEPRIPDNSTVEENSPNRKLCFMETLNLTLSPIKKPVLPIDAGQDVPTTKDKVAENKADDENLQFYVEDMCVIDEAECSELNSGPEDVAQQSSDIPKESSSEKTHKRCDDAEDVLEKNKCLSEAAAGKLLEEITVQTTSAFSQPLNTAESQQSVHLTPKSLEGSSPKTTESNISKSLTSDRRVDKSKPVEVTDNISDTRGSVSKQHTSNSLLKVNPGNTTEETVSEPDVLESRTVEKSVPVDSVEDAPTASPSKEPAVAEDVPDSPRRQKIPAAALTPVCQQGLHPSASVTSIHKKDPSHMEVAEDVPDSPRRQKIPAAALTPVCQQGLHPSASVTSIHKKDASHMENGPKDTDAVSSTISLDSLPQEGLSLPEAILVLTQTNEEANDSNTIVTEPSSSTGCIAVYKVSSTTEETVLPGNSSGLASTPKKSFGPGKSRENNVKPSSSVPLLHDEDSMMRTLSNLKKIPDAISPLRSPMRITKRSHIHVHGKPGHVKSLQKDFSITPVDVNSKKLDVNKENKYPGSPAKLDIHNVVDKVSEMPSSVSDTELEEGEILSESDEAAAGSPLPANKKVKLVRPVRNKPSPKSVLKRISEEMCVGSKETSEEPGSSTRSPKSRFKTVCPAASKASFSNMEEIMETFRLVRSEIRKKYMKLHKTFPRKSFNGIMDNYQESFLEFVDGAHFGEICSQAVELKSKLKNLIVPVFSKMSNNGIVKRIFEQQAVDLKQKLWDFVDAQVDCLFMDIHATLHCLCKPARAPAEKKKPAGNEEVSAQPSLKKPHFQQKEAQSSPTSMNQIKPCTVVPYKTGLGSRGKDIRITHEEKDCSSAPHLTNTQSVTDFPPRKTIPPTPEKNSMASLVVSQSGSLLDKTDFELLTEQQASSLTFNLVRDSQMGEIFKCLLQGSDLLENSSITGDSTAWSLCTPRKDGERFISITTPNKFDSPSKLRTPSKFNTPSKLIATWSSISPRRMSSPRLKEQIPLNPALFDENCLLELPMENKIMLQSSLSSQRSYSILTEDLAVSLTIPSPLKSDSTLSFLQPSSMRNMSTPESVISAHISEDALLDGEDATEQDIHLALDTDNSSCGSGSSVASSAHASSFLFKPDVPMQALVMERSNDHFILKIRQTAATRADVTLTADESLSQTLTEEDHQHREGDIAGEESQTKSVLWDKSQKGSTVSHVVLSDNSLSNFVESSRICQAATGSELSKFVESSGICQAATSSESCVTQDESQTLSKDPSHKKEDASTQQRNARFSFSEESQPLPGKKEPMTIPSDNSLHSGAQSSVQIGQAAPGKGVATESQTHLRVEDMQTQRSPSKALLSDSERNAMEASESDSVPEKMSSTPEKDQWDCDRGRKRKKHQDQLKAKRPRRKEVEITEKMVPKDDNESISSPMSLSPNSLSAKNVVRKKGEVVIAWTRDEDRAILIELKTKGASRDTFSALSERLSKPSGQIAHRFNQLMKLFKRHEKMDT
ncbi:CASP8-associated protein 2 [Hippoglossus stenolepis]|uniref:CASP8-associated protein 2 n=1 Tax=Hippoglossus stenolepis TaxID=195615 RepID=UPI001FAF8695|nr:CASP8-associated protein 2 [Hippoglossus stenolepis]